MVLRYSDGMWGGILGHLCYSDGIRGAGLGLMYNLLLQLDALYSSPIQGLPDTVWTKVTW
jgi:hypothetical protein